MADGSVFVRVHVLAICDEVDERTDQEDLFDLGGVRTQVLAPSLPYVHPQLCIFLQVTGHGGMASGHVLVVHEVSDQEVMHVPIEEFQLSGPLEIISV